MGLYCHTDSELLRNSFGVARGGRVFFIEVDFLKVNQFYSFNSNLYSRVYNAENSTVLEKQADLLRTNVLRLGVMLSHGFVQVYLPVGRQVDPHRFKWYFKLLRGFVFDKFPSTSSGNAPIRWASVDLAVNRAEFDDFIFSTNVNHSLHF